MSSTHPLQVQEQPSRRRLNLLLLALNLFFIGTIGAFFARSYLTESAPHGKVSPAQRIETIAALLSPGDAAILRMEFTKSSESIEHASDAFRQAREKVRVALRAEPFDLGATRAAMTEAGSAHLQFEQLTQNVIASAAASMTHEGRRILADFLPRTRASAQETRIRFPAYSWLHSH